MASTPRTSSTRGGDQDLHPAPRRQVPRELQEDHRRSRPTADVLRLPRRTLGSTRGPRTLSSRPSPPWAAAQSHRGADSPIAALSTVFKLVESAERRWPAVNAPHLVALIRSGARFERRHPLEHPEPARPARTASTRGSNGSDGYFSTPDRPVEPERCNTATAIER